MQRKRLKVCPARLMQSPTPRTIVTWLSAVPRTSPWHRIGPWRSRGLSRNTCGTSLCSRPIREILYNPGRIWRTAWSYLSGTALSQAARTAASQRTPCRDISCFGTATFSIHCIRNGVCRTEAIRLPGTCGMSTPSDCWSDVPFRRTVYPSIGAPCKLLLLPTTTKTIKAWRVFLLRPNQHFLDRYRKHQKQFR